MNKIPNITIQISHFSLYSFIFCVTFSGTRFPQFQWKLNWARKVSGSLSLLAYTQIASGFLSSWYSPSWSALFLSWFGVSLESFQLGFWGYLVVYFVINLVWSRWVLYMIDRLAWLWAIQLRGFIEKCRKKIRFWCFFIVLFNGFGAN